MPRFAPILAWLAVAALSPTAHAQDVPSIGPSGLPGLFRVGVAGSAEPSLAVAATGGYGLTEAQEGEGASHHRLAGILGVGVTPTEWLGLALRLDGRYDNHPQGDDGLIGAPSLIVRAGSSFGAIRLGAEIGVSVPGSDAPSLELGALVLDASVLAAFAPESSPFALAARIGYRLDGSADAIEDADPGTPGVQTRLSRGDRIAIGLSEFDALLFGIGVSYRAEAIELLGEFTWDLLLGDGAPSATVSPMRVTLGARYHASDSLAFVLVGDVSPSGRPETDDSNYDDGPLFPIEPRVSIWAGVRWTMPFAERATPVEGEIEDEPEPVEETPVVEPQPTEETPPVEETPQLPPGQIRGLVRDFNGNALSAQIIVERVAAEGEAAAEPVRAQTDADGFFEVDVQPGSYRVTIEAPRHRSQERTVTVEENGVTILNADLRRGGG